jgi:hypothetical protein
MSGRARGGTTKRGEGSAFRWITRGLVVGALALSGCGGKEKPPAPPPSDCALRIPEQGARATVTDTDGLFGSAFTLDFWLRFDGASYDPSDATTFEPHRVVAVESVTEDALFYVAIDLAFYQGIICSLTNATTSLVVSHDLPTPPKSWHAVACELNEDGIGLWYDGELADWQGVRPGFLGYPVHYPHDGSPLVFVQGDGASPAQEPEQNMFAGAMDEIRISNVALFDPHLGDDGFPSNADSYVPEQSAVATESTAALWHFDECSGDNASDSGPGHRSAVLENGATWEAQSGTTP